MDEIKFRTSIKTSFKQRVLLKGSLLALPGVLLLLFASIYLPVEKLSVWGLPIFLLGIGLITIGLLPYRRMCLQEKKPDELILDAISLQLFQKGKPALRFELQNINRIDYVEKLDKYGIRIWFNSNSSEPTKPSHRPVDSIFLPFFSERTYKDLADFLNKNGLRD